MKARFKHPDGDRSELLSTMVRGTGGRAQHLPLAAAVAEYGLLLRDAPDDIMRWDDLLHRLDRLVVPATQRHDVDGFRNSSPSVKAAEKGPMTTPGVIFTENDLRGRLHVAAAARRQDVNGLRKLVAVGRGLARRGQ